MGLGRVQARGQVTIPAEVREALGIQAGDVLLVEVTGPDDGRFRMLGWLDAGLFVHPFFRDPDAKRCRAVVKALQVP